MCQQNNKLVKQHVSENMSTIEKRFWTRNGTNTWFLCDGDTCYSIIGISSIRATMKGLDSSHGILEL